MRIRKHAAKLLLGSGLSHHSPPAPAAAAAAADAEGLYLCELNCSPWDAMDFNPHYLSFQEEEGEEGRGVTENGFGFGGDEEEDHILGASEAITSVAVAEPYYNGSGEGADLKKVKKRRRRRKKEDHDQKKSIVSVTDSTKSGSVGTGVCKKNDGKGWHCKRPANLNHTLCDHHLNQLKSYGARDSAREAAAAAYGDSDSQLKNQHKPDVPHVKSRKPKSTTTSGVASESAGDGYYYYSGFGPWQGKSRSNGMAAKVNELVEEGNNESESGEGSDAPVAGDDLDDDSDNDDEGNVGRIGRKKRGRKPVKARPLKSLL